MTDTLLQNGETAVDERGCHIMISHSHALMQRARIRLTVRRGSFIYDRNLGSRLGGSTDSPGEAAFLANEALTGLEKTTASALSGGANPVIRVNIDGATEDMEVRRYGNV